MLPVDDPKKETKSDDHLVRKCTLKTAKNTAVGVEIHPKCLISIFNVWGENANTNFWLGWKNIARFARVVENETF